MNEKTRDVPKKPKCIGHYQCLLSASGNALLTFPDNPYFDREIKRMFPEAHYDVDAAFWVIKRNTGAQEAIDWALEHGFELGPNIEHQGYVLTHEIAEAV